MVSVANLLRILKSAVNLLPEKSQSLLQPGWLNTVPLEIPLKFGTTGVKELFLWHRSLKQQEKRMGSNTVAVRGWSRARRTHIHPLTPVGAHTHTLHLDFQAMHGIFRQNSNIY